MGKNQDLGRQNRLRQARICSQFDRLSRWIRQNSREMDNDFLCGGRLSRKAKVKSKKAKGRNDLNYWKHICLRQYSAFQNA